MSVDRHEILQVIEELIKRPAMYAGTPEAADGMANALGALYIAAVKNEPLQVAFRSAFAIVKDITKNVPHEECQAPLLCDERCYPDRETSFDAFSHNCADFLQRLKDITKH